MSDSERIHNPVATDVHVAAPGRLEAVRGRRGIFRRALSALGRMRGGWERVARTISSAKRSHGTIGDRTGSQGSPPT
jgi:hypothetical protein